MGPTWVPQAEAASSVVPRETSSLKVLRAEFPTCIVFAGDQERERGWTLLALFFLHLSSSSSVLPQLCIRELEVEIPKMWWNFQAPNDCLKYCFFISPCTAAAPTNKTS